MKGTAREDVSVHREVTKIVPTPPLIGMPATLGEMVPFHSGSSTCNVWRLYFYRMSIQRNVEVRM